MTSPRAYRFTKAGNLEAGDFRAIMGRAASAMSAPPSGTTFLIHRDDGSLQHMVLMPDRGDTKNTALQLARSVAAHSEETDAPDLSAAQHIGRARYRRGFVPGAGTQAGGDVTVLGQMMSTALRDGEWCAVSVRQPHWWERRWWTTWTNGLFKTHHSLGASTVIASITAGGHDAQTTENIIRQATGAMPGWDYEFRVWPVDGRIAAAVLAGIAVLVGAAAWGAPRVSLGSLAGTLWTAAVVLAVAAVATMIGRVPIGGAAAARKMRRGDFPAPPFRMGPPRKPQAARAVSDEDGVVHTMMSSTGDYPLHLNTFMLGPVMPLTLVAPHAGSASGAGKVRSRPAPLALRSRVGASLGESGGTACYLSERDRWSGTFLAGAPGSGKTQMMLTLWGFDAFGRVQGTAPSGGHAMVWFDTKMDGEATASAARLSRAAGDKFVIITVGDETSPLGLEMLPTRGSAAARGAEVATMFRHVFGETSIGAESFMTLARVFTGGFAVAGSTGIQAQVPGLPTGRSAVFYADVLLSNRGSDLAKSLYHAVIQAASSGAYERDVAEGADQLRPMFEVSESERIRLSRAPRSKTDAIMLAEHWWSRPTRIRWDQILAGKAAVIINFGGLRAHASDPSVQATDQAQLNQELRDSMAAMMMYTLRQEIERSCRGWRSSDQAVSVYADEVKYLAGASPDVITWLRNDGRAFGVRPTFATQFPEQLEQQVRDALLGFGTVATFAQSNPNVAAALASQFALDGTDWGASDVSMLGRGEAIIATTVDGERQPAFTTRLPFEAAYALSPQEFAVLEGFTPPAPAL